MLTRVPDPVPRASSAFSLVAAGVQNEKERTSQPRENVNMVVPYKFLNLGEKWPHGLRCDLLCTVTDLQLAENIEKS
jgi:hypothetical protein